MCLKVPSPQYAVLAIEPGASVKNEKIIYRLTYKDKSQTTKTVYVHKYNLKKVKSMIKNFEKIKKAIDELVEINIKLLRADQKLTSEKNK